MTRRGERRGGRAGAQQTRTAAPSNRPARRSASARFASCSLYCVVSGDDADLRRQTQEIDGILPRQIGDRDELPLLPQEMIGEARNVAHVNAGADDAAALSHRSQRERDERADRCKDDRGVERLRRRLVRAAGPNCAEAVGKGLARRIAGAREGEDRAPLPSRDLRHDMRGGAEPVEAEPPAVAGDHQRAPADEAGAEQRSKRHVAAVLAERKGIARIGDRRGREAAVPAVAGEERAIAEVFVAARAIGADAAAMAEPRHADALAQAQSHDVAADRIDPADDLVAGDDRHDGIGQLAVDDVQIGPADAAGGDAKADFTGSGKAVRKLRPFESLTELLQHHRMHRILRRGSSAATAIGDPMRTRSHG